MQYEAYKTEDFLADENFQNWVANRINDKFWSQWVLENSNKKVIIDEAIIILNNVELKENYLDSNNIDTQWIQLKERIENKPTHKLLANGSLDQKNKFMPNWIKIAAAISFLVISTLGTYLYIASTSNDVVAYTTGYGEKMEIILPDGSKVKINSNSKVTVAKKWDANAFVKLN